MPFLEAPIGATTGAVQEVAKCLIIKIMPCYRCCVSGFFSFAALTYANCLLKRVCSGKT